MNQQPDRLVSECDRTHTTPNPPPNTSHVSQTLKNGPKGRAWLGSWSFSSIIAFVCGWHAIVNINMIGWKSMEGKRPNLCRETGWCLHRTNIKLTLPRTVRFLQLDKCCEWGGRNGEHSGTRNHSQFNQKCWEETICRLAGAELNEHHYHSIYHRVLLSTLSHIHDLRHTCSIEIQTNSLYVQDNQSTPQSWLIRKCILPR